ncbi:cupredoxin domain-containing protein [Paenibacillus glycinis]|uniref:Cytochrome C oxidase subunit II n=1 Tax=Paenibacillus glycinis TaxID=2697035 RepID=A0ABW9XK11_9BACL|nr:cytochrome C oxidase subunit II [Paenibacillus glycinis]NBD22896.1 cytochrome C oxidase subunit II [Paenibacillus glycinis]
MTNRWRTAAFTAVLLCTAALAASGCGKSDNANNGANNGGTNAGTNNGANAGAGSGGGNQAITVKATNFKFDQTEIHVKQGDKVTITLVDEAGMHGFTIPDFGVDIKENNGTATFTADKTGEHPYNCSIVCGSGHANMVGKLIVD